MTNIKALVDRLRFIANHTHEVMAEEIEEVCDAAADALAPLAEPVAEQLDELFDRILNRSSHCMVQDGTGAYHDAIKVKRTDIEALRAELERANQHIKLRDSIIKAHEARAETSERDVAALKANLKGRCLYCVACDDRSACIDNMGCLHVPIACGNAAIDAALSALPGEER